MIPGRDEGAPGALIYAAVGASDVVGEGADDPDAEAWPVVLHQRLPVPARLHRLGSSSSTAEEAIAEQLPQAERLGPDLVTVWLAVNDYRRDVPLGRYAEHLGEVVGRLAATGAQVFVANLPDLTGIPEVAEGRDPVRLVEDLARWNAAIAGIVAANGASLVDLVEAAEGLDEDMSVLVSDDGLHPSTLGHLALAEIFFHHIEAAEVWRPRVRGLRP